MIQFQEKFWRDREDDGQADKQILFHKQDPSSYYQRSKMWGIPFFVVWFSPQKVWSTTTKRQMMITRKRKAYKKND